MKAENRQRLLLAPSAALFAAGFGCGYLVNSLLGPDSQPVPMVDGQSLVPAVQRPANIVPQGRAMVGDGTVSPVSEETGRTPEAIMSRIKEIMRREPSLENDALLSALWKQLGASLGKAALDYARQQKIDRERCFANAVLGWASVEPQNAWEFVFSGDSGAGRSLGVMLTGAILRTGNFKLVAELIPKVNDPRLRATASAVAAAQMARYSPDDAEALLNALDERSRSHALGSIAADWGESDPQSTLNWLASQPLPSVESAIGRVVSGWVARGDAESFQEWVVSQTASGVRVAAVAAYFHTDQGQRAGPGSPLLDMLPVAEREGVAIAAIEKNRYLYPETAAKWALRMNDGAQRDATLQRLAVEATREQATKMIEVINMSMAIDGLTKAHLVGILNAKLPGKG